MRWSAAAVVVLLASLLGSAPSRAAGLDALSYIGGSSFDRAQGCTVGGDGYVWAVGNTRSPDLPTTPGAYDRSYGGDTDGFIAKFTSDLSTLVALTYIGGSGHDRAYGITTDAQGFVYVVGITKGGFPTTPGAHRRTPAGNADVWVAKFTPDLSTLLFSTLIGGAGTDWTRGGVRVDAQGNVLVPGQAGVGFPTTSGVFQTGFGGGGSDAFVAKLAADGSRLVWSTLIGGSGEESFYGNLALHGDGTVSVAGFSNSADFPTTPGAFERTVSGAPYPTYDGDGVVVHLSADGRSQHYSSYLWGAVSGNGGLALDAAGRALVWGSASPVNAGAVPVSGGAFQRVFAGGSTDATLARVSANGSAVQVATFSGGAGADASGGVGVASDGTLYVGGNTNSANYPTTSDALQRNLAGSTDAFFQVVGPDLSLRYATYLGGTGADRGRCLARTPDGRVLVTGDTDGGLPVSPNAYDRGQNGDRDGFLAIFDVPQPGAGGGGGGGGYVAGGGSKSTDCLAEFNAPANLPAKKPKKVRCVDNDPTCDSDPTTGVCQFSVEVCVNVSDPALPQCGPDRIDRFSVENVQPDTDARHDFEFQALEDTVNAFALPVTANQTDVCSGAVGMELVLPVRVAKGKAKYQKMKKKLRTHARGRVDDSDKLDMQCLPDTTTSPCDTVTSTFDQIQRHILTPGCGRDTCHSAVGPLHDLSLAPGETLGFLVGVAPNNADADAAGKLRVDPGNPANSFLLDKLRGKLGSGEGSRMPLGLKKLKGSQIRMIEEWIAAGAPATGFVSRLGCQP